jgi:hypothetical protein
MATRRAVRGYPDEGERLAIRRVLATSGAEWYEAEVAVWARQPDSPRVALLRDLINVTQRSDLAPLLSSLPQAEMPDFHWRLSREELSKLHRVGDSKQTLGEATKAAHLAIDPESPAPSRAWQAKFARVALDRFARSRQLHTGGFQSLDDLDLEKIEPALAAWAPKAGTLIWRAFFADIPRRIDGNDPDWSWVLEEHLPVLTASHRRRLLRSILHAMPKVKTMNHALESGYACVVAQSAPSKRVRFLLEHPFEAEWHTLYEPLPLSRDTALQQQAVAAVRAERDPLRRMRGRFLLSWIGGMDLTAQDIQSFITDVAHDGDIGMQLLKKSRLSPGTPPDALAPLAEVVSDLADVALQYDAFLLSRKLGMERLFVLSRLHRQHELMVQDPISRMKKPSSRDCNSSARKSRSTSPTRSRTWGDPSNFQGILRPRFIEKHSRRGWSCSFRRLSTLIFFIVACWCRSCVMRWRPLTPKRCNCGN